MARVFLFVLDSFGIGGAPDAADYNDIGANTFLHIAERCAHEATKLGRDKKYLELPNLEALGLAHSAFGACGIPAPGFSLDNSPMAIAAHACEISNGKDTPSGHWEIAGLPVLFDWGYFPVTPPCFSNELLNEIYMSADINSSLGNCHASGTQIIFELGQEHILTGHPIFYTSTDSVFQIAAHEDPDIFGLQKLYKLCESVFTLVAPLNIGRVIARPFIGDEQNDFKRTGNRRDFSIPPHEPTLLDRAKSAGRDVITIGKVADIFANRGITKSYKANGNQALYETTLNVMDIASDGSLIFTNFVDFDMLYGHRRDVSGYASALEQFDNWLPTLMEKLRDDDIMIITADHGCDPTWHGTDHTREQVPVLVYGPKINGKFIGQLKSFSDIGASVADYLDIDPGPYGESFLSGSPK